jgi:hypothetical protein
MLEADNEVDAVRMGHEIQRARLNRVAKAFCRPVLTRHLPGHRFRVPVRDEVEIHHGGELFVS